MSRPKKGFRNVHRWLSAPSTVGGLIGAGLAGQYGIVELSLPEGTGPWFLGIVLVAAVIASLWGYSQEQAGLVAVRKVARLASSPSREQLRAAVQELTRFPDRVFRTQLQGWAFGTVTVAIGCPVLIELPWTFSIRIVAIGLIFAPLCAVLTYLWCSARARSLTAAIGEAGLTTEELVSAIPARAVRLRARVVVFAALLALAPLALVAELSYARVDGALDQLTQVSSPAARTEVIERAERRGATSLALLAIGVVALLGVCGLFAGSALASPLAQLGDQAARIARGDLRTQRVVAAEDELWDAAAAFAQVHANLVRAIGQVRSAGTRVRGASDQLTSGASEQEKGAEEQGAALNQTVVTTEELNRSAGQVAESSRAVASLAERTLSAARAGQRGSQEFGRAMEWMREDNAAVGEAVMALNKHVQQVVRVVEFIDGVADKADLLALNAELEGTRAGEVGRGFSLVAAEIRRLAESVTRSTSEISALIEDIRNATNAAVMTTDSGMKVTQEGTKLAEEVSDALGRILDVAQQTSEAARAISLATQQQRTGTDQLTQAMSEILRLTRESADATRKLNASNQALSELAERLNLGIARYEVG